jgi:hypothetical protein
LKILEHLLKNYGGEPFVQAQPRNVGLFERPLGNELFKLLSFRNGLFLFDQSLRFFPTEDCASSYGLETWNSTALWKHTYENLPDQLFCFAEDIFGNQFALLQESIVMFQCETAGLEQIASSFEDFAGRIILDADYLTGRSLAISWAKKFGALPVRNRLVAHTPFVLGGAYSLQNLVAVESAKAMRIRGPLASKIADFPDGTQISIDLES